VVSSVEAGFPALYQTRTLYYYPIGISEADYVVVLNGGVDEKGQTKIAGAISYRGENASLDGLLQRRLEALGFEISKAKVFDDLVVVPRGGRGMAGGKSVL
jgi:hypothetical protein